MTQSLLLADETCREKNSHLFKDGCTAVIFAFLTLSYCEAKRFAIFGNVGDARAIMGTVFISFNDDDETNNGHSLNTLSKKNHPPIIEFEVHRMTQDHKPTVTSDHDPSEVIRIRNCGGYVINSRTMGTYGVARALGDWESRPFLSNEPHVNGCVLTCPITTTCATTCEGNHDSNNCEQLLTTTTLSTPRTWTLEKQMIILGCDGVWDVLSDQDVFEMTAFTWFHSNHSMTINNNNTSSIPLSSSITTHSTNKVSAVIRDFAHSAGSTDNISVIVIEL
ncbi:hypothetical protein FDP41_010828 [Naegleria fowleri]|uniref:PPM-type phosphatase domain-containing protein n=1 Tax=Naegleria fowleri TaxID=5763 RepID=A0A6A5CC77_NAEFO|nr:uncharacterized protein FDP41_010828 [Naegleria fowleri]KAF0982849.1 hypothetical protein FDP41_010828 [Naegleria fowleri]CAG4717801.1 unnamed protein product [Naegleria fowleri]